MEAKIKHLEFIQSAITRMASNSFLLKGWAITIVGALLALSLKELDNRYIWISLAALSFFWLLDGYYLSRERMFVALYDHVRNIHHDKTDFSMDTRPFRRRTIWIRCAFSTTLIVFYGGLFFVHGLILCSL